MSLITSIPTDYAGRRFRSRFEADVARLLDGAHIEWEYEPKSFLLADGTHFMPDFYVPAGRLWIECRGYRSAKGDRQLLGFGKELEIGTSFLVLSANGRWLLPRLSVEVAAHGTWIIGVLREFSRYVWKRQET